MSGQQRYIRLWKITIGLGLIGLLLGLVLRFYFVEPLGFNFRFILHAHSHTMLLGWLFSGLLLLIYGQYFSQIPRWQYGLLLGLQLCVLGMLCSFPFQGYGLYSIAFSTLHLIISYLLLGKLWKHSRGQGLCGRLLRAGIAFHFLSTLGPVALGPMIANDMRGTALYDQAIYFYLHFQYNGSFFLFLLTLMLRQWQKANEQMPSRLFLWLMLSGVILTWAHSLEFSYQGICINAIGFTGSALQIGAGIILFRQLDFRKIGRLGLIIIAALALKWILQLVGSTPAMGDLVAQNRSLIIAWLHFIFLGIYTPFLWLQLPGVNTKFNGIWGLYWLFFLLTELLLILPFLNLLPPSSHWPALRLAAYCGLALAWFILALRWWKLRRLDHWA